MSKLNGIIIDGKIYEEKQVPRGKIPCDFCGLSGKVKGCNSFCTDAGLMNGYKLCFVERKGQKND